MESEDKGEPVRRFSPRHNHDNRVNAPGETDKLPKNDKNNIKKILKKWTECSVYYSIDYVVTN